MLQLQKGCCMSDCLQLIIIHLSPYLHATRCRALGSRSLPLAAARDLLVKSLAQIVGSVAHTTRWIWYVNLKTSPLSI